MIGDGFVFHAPPFAEVRIAKKGKKASVVISDYVSPAIFDYVSPAIFARLAMAVTMRVLKKTIGDFRAPLLLKSAPISIALVLIYSAVCTLAVFVFLRRQLRLDAATAYCSSLPGGLSPVIGLAGEFRRSILKYSRAFLSRPLR